MAVVELASWLNAEAERRGTTSDELFDEMAAWLSVPLGAQAQAGFNATQRALNDARTWRSS